MNYRPYTKEDDHFLREMLYEAVFWSRNESDRPSLEEGLSYDYTKHILVDFGKRNGDLAIIAENDAIRVGAAFIRYWDDPEAIRGYVSSQVPVLVIGVHSAYRRQGVGSVMLEELKELALVKGIDTISLCVTKSNIAYDLYRQQDFEVVEDLGDSVNMLWKYKR